MKKFIFIFALFACSGAYAAEDDKEKVREIYGYFMDCAGYTCFHCRSYEQR